MPKHHASKMDRPYICLAATAWRPADYSAGRVKTISAYIDTVLQQEFSLSIEGRVRHYMTISHFNVLMRHLWQKDWYSWYHSRSLVQDHAAYLLCIYTSARVGEYFESNAHPGSGRGLLYKDIDFVVFRNGKGNAELAIRVVRDAKGRTDTPHKRPKHGVYEDIEPLYANPVLPLLAIALADDAFVDYQTFVPLGEVSGRRLVRDADNDW